MEAGEEIPEEAEEDEDEEVEREREEGVVFTWSGGHGDPSFGSRREAWEPFEVWRRRGEV